MTVEFTKLKRLAVALTVASLTFFVLTACNEKKDTSGEDMAMLMLLSTPTSTSTSTGTGGSGTTETTTTAPTSYPSGISASASNASVALSWSSVSGATSYKIYYSTSSSVSSSSSSVTTTSTSYTHSGLTNGNSYYYKIAAVNSAGEGPTSGTTSAGPESWTQATSGLTTQINAIRYLTINSTSKFWAVGASGKVISSTDGITWGSQEVSCASSSDSMYDIATNGTKATVVGGSGKYYYYDGTSWTCGTLGSSSYGWAGVEYLNSSVWVAYGLVHYDTLDYRMAIAVTADPAGGWSFGYDTVSSRYSTSSSDNLTDAIYDSSTYRVVGKNGWISSCTSGCTNKSGWTTNQVSTKKDYSGVFVRSSKYYLTSSNSLNYFDYTTAWSSFYSVYTAPNTNIYEILDRGTTSGVLAIGSTFYSTNDGTDWVKRAIPSSTGTLLTIACDSATSATCVMGSSTGEIYYQKY